MPDMLMSHIILSLAVISFLCSNKHLFILEDDFFADLNIFSIIKRLLPESIKNPKVFQKYYRSGFKVAYEILHDEQDAHDVVYTTLLKIHRLPYVPKGVFDAYFYTAVRNNARTFLKKKRRRKLEEREYGREMMNIAETPQEIQTRKVKIEAVQTAIRMLPQPQQTIMWMKHVEEKTANEIAVELDITKRAVENHLYRGRKKLEKILSKIIDPILI